MATDPNTQTITVQRGLGMYQTVAPLVPGGGDDDVTGWTLRFRVFRRVGAAALVTLTLGSGITLDDADDGLFSLRMSPDQVTALAAGDYLWDLERTDAGNQYQIAGGPFVVLEADGQTPAPSTECPPPEYPIVWGKAFRAELKPQKAAAVVPSGAKSAVRVRLFTPAGRPAVVDAADTCGSADAVAKVWEAVSGEPVDAACELADAADTVLVVVPDAVDAAPGVYEVEARVLDANDAARAFGRCWLYVEPSGFGGYLQGPPPVDEVRTAVRDYPQANRLLGDYEFSASEIAAAVVRACRRFNASPPQSTLAATTAGWPRSGWANLLDGVLAELFETATAYFRRGHLPYSAGGIAVDDMAKEKDYLQAAAYYRQRFEQWTKLTKMQANLEDGWASGVSIYGQL